MLRSLFVLFTLSISTSCLLATPPTTQPSAPDAAQVQRLVRQLESPSVKTRDAAAKELEELGESILPLLERTAEDAAFETQARILEIIAQLRPPQRGVIVYKVSADSQAARLGIKAGDVITALNDRACGNLVEFDRVGKLLAAQPRTLVIRSDQPRRKVTIQPGVLGVYLADYADSYGPSLAAALRAFEAEQMPAARARMEEALDAGLTFRRHDGLQVIYALATYFSGQTKEARAMLEEWVEATTGHTGWTELTNLLPTYHPGCTHLVMDACNRSVALSGGRAEWNLFSAMVLSGQARCVEAMVRCLETTAGQSWRSNAYVQNAELHVLWSGFWCMGCEDEALKIAARVPGHDPSEDLVLACALFAETHDRPDLGLKLNRQVHAGKPSERYRSIAAAQIIRLHLLSDQADEARKFIARLTPAEAAGTVHWCSAVHCCWPEALAVEAELARLALRYDTPGPGALGSSLSILSSQPDPDLAELESICDRAQTAADSQVNASTTIDDHYTYADVAMVGRGIVAKIRGDYPTATECLTEFSARAPMPVPASSFAAITFLKEHATRLQGDLASWRNCMSAYPLKDGGYILFTREQRLGCASAGVSSIREIPCPLKHWQPISGADLILNSQGHNGILSRSLCTIYQLNERHTGWEPLAELPLFGARWRLEPLSAAFDNLIPLLRAHGEGPARIVAPEQLDDPPARVTSFMLSDGTWMSCDIRTGTVWQPRALIADALGRSAEIYAVASCDQENPHALIYTSLGLLDWRPEDQTIKPVALPGVSIGLPVTETAEGAKPPKGMLRVALFPKDGGTTFLINTSTGEVRREGCINESLPVTYWRQKPIELKRKLLGEALREAGVKSPWTADAPSELQ